MFFSPFIYLFLYFILFVFTSPDEHYYYKFIFRTSFRVSLSDILLPIKDERKQYTNLGPFIITFQNVTAIETLKLALNRKTEIFYISQKSITASFLARKDQTI